MKKKIQIFNLCKEHPQWSLKTLHSHGATALTRKDELTRWEKEIINGGTIFDKNFAITQWTLKRFNEAQANKQHVTVRNLQEWAMQGASQYLSDNFKFTSSIQWVNEFKQKFHIGQRKITIFVKPTEVKSLEKVLEDARQFQEECSALIPKYNPDFVLNTDQTGCEYRVNIQRTMTFRGQKRVEVNLGDVNKVTHSYTAQYTLVASGKILPKVFLCLQETTGSFGPVITKRMNELTEKFNNVYITCSKSGKLNSDLMNSFVSNVLKSYVNNHDFLLLLDSWSGHKKSDPFDQFINSNHQKSCTVKIIPPGYTPLAQPCDVYFY